MAGLAVVTDRSGDTFIIKLRIIFPPVLGCNDFFSFASVNIPMMAVWLSGLTGEERERFQMLRRKFSEIQVSLHILNFCQSLRQRCSYRTYTRTELNIKSRMFFRLWCHGSCI